jgi:hypothetical protein
MILISQMKERELDAGLLNLVARAASVGIWEQLEAAHVRAYAHGNRIGVNFPTDLAIEFTVSQLNDAAIPYGRPPWTENRALAAVVIIVAAAMARSLRQRFASMDIEVKQRDLGLEMAWIDQESSREFRLGIDARPLT